jgi:hypothetical protein
MADYQAEARKAAQRYGLNPGVFVRQIRQESGFNPNARSPAGAQGIAQIMPATAKGWGVNPNDPVAALNAAAKHMARYVKQYGSYRDALVAYNAGPGRVGQSLPAETQNYIKTILGGRDPGTSSVRTPGGATATAASAPSTRTTVTKTPGVDKRIARAALIQSFLEDKSSDPVEFAAQANALKDIAPTATTKTVRIPGAAATPSGGATSGTVGGSFGKDHSPLLELIHNTGSGPGYAVKDGRKVNGPQFYSGVWAGHANHVHVAAGPKTIVALGKLAKKMGLRVGENPHFGGVSPVHVPGSYHYRGEAIDVSGDPQKMNEYARRVEAVYGIK